MKLSRSLLFFVVQQRPEVPGFESNPFRGWAFSLLYESAMNQGLVKMDWKWLAGGSAKEEEGAEG